MLARSNPRSLRAPLAEGLNDKVRPILIDSVVPDLPSQIPIVANTLYEAGAIRGIQTSLVSKFAFCLRPEIIVPHDLFSLLGFSRSKLCSLWRNLPQYWKRMR